MTALALPSMYQGNALIAGCGPILSEEDILRRLAHYPPEPTREERGDRNLALHSLPQLERLFVPTASALRDLPT